MWRCRCHQSLTVTVYSLAGTADCFLASATAKDGVPGESRLALTCVVLPVGNGGTHTRGIDHHCTRPQCARCRAGNHSRWQFHLQRHRGRGLTQRNGTAQYRLYQCQHCVIALMLDSCCTVHMHGLCCTNSNQNNGTMVTRPVAIQLKHLLLAMLFCYNLLCTTSIAAMVWALLFNSVQNSVERQTLAEQAQTATTGSG